MSSKLNSLVRATNDTDLLTYAFTNLGRGVSNHACFSHTLSALRNKWLYWLAMQQTPMLLDLYERQMAAGLFQLSSIAVSIRDLLTDSEDILRKKIKNQNLLLRILTMDAIGHRRCHLEADLIECLNDPHPAIREAAHKSLVRVARGTDFGPIPGASQTGVAHSVEKWRHWLALQTGETPVTIAKGEAIAAAKKPIPFDPAKAVHLVLEHGNRELQTASSEATRLCEELVKAEGDEQRSVLARLRDAKGIDNTDALALAIPKLSGAIQRETRDALAQRLTRMTAATLRDKLQEDGVEVRRAAALACGRKNAREHIPDLLRLLDDPEAVVVQAARTALKTLTDEDFGPTEGSGRRGRAIAAAAWRKWWKEQGRQEK